TLTLIAGEDGLHREILTSDISRPGIEMTGYFKFYPKERLQLIGRTEMAYFLDLNDEEQHNRAHQLCTDVTPRMSVTRVMEVTEKIIEVANHDEDPNLHSSQQTTRVISSLTNYLDIKFASFTAIHGVLVDIYGVCVLNTGLSGVGKSQTDLVFVIS